MQVGPQPRPFDVWAQERDGRRPRQREQQRLTWRARGPGRVWLRGQLGLPQIAYLVSGYPVDLEHEARV